LDIGWNTKHHLLPVEESGEGETVRFRQGSRPGLSDGGILKSSKLRRSREKVSVHRKRREPGGKRLRNTALLDSSGIG